MLEFFRRIAHPSSSSAMRIPSRIALISARFVISSVVFIFLMDAVNADVIYAAIRGDMQYQDNPAIVDSIFDTNSAQYYVSTSVATHANLPLQLNQKLAFHGHTVFEDADSPTVLECDDTNTLIGECFVYPEPETERVPSVTNTINRPTTFLQLLI